MTINYDFTGCDVLWFSQQPHDFGSFVKGAPPPKRYANRTDFLSSGQWLKSDGRQSDVLSAGWVKAIDGPPAGTFVMQMKQESIAWSKAIRTNDALLVFMSNLDSKGKVVPSVVSMVFVDSVHLIQAVDQSGAHVQAVSISARDMGKVLENTATIADPAFLEPDQHFYNQVFFRNLTSAASFSPTETVLQILDLVYAPQTSLRFGGPSSLVATQWRFPGAEDVPIMSALDVSSFVGVTFGYGLPSEFPFAESGNVWEVMKNFQNGCLNEMFVDVRDINDESRGFVEHHDELVGAYMAPEDVARQKRERDRVRFNLLFAAGGLLSRAGFEEPIPAPLDPHDELAIAERESHGFFEPYLKIPGVKDLATFALVLRQRPYDTGSFFKLPEHVVDETEILHSDVAPGEGNVVNFFRFSCPVLDRTVQEKAFGIVVSKRSIARNGLRRKEIETIFPFVGRAQALSKSAGDAPLDFNAIYEYYVWLVSTWFAYNELFQEGGMSLRFRPDIRVGNRLKVVRHKAGAAYEEYYYVQTVRHSFSYVQGQSRTQVVVSRGLDSRDFDTNPAWALYWNKDGRVKLIDDPLELYQSDAVRPGEYLNPNRIPSREETQAALLKDFTREAVFGASATLTKRPTPRDSAPKVTAPPIAGPIVVGSAVTGAPRYAPNTPEQYALFTAAALSVGLPAEWGSSPDLAYILHRESGGWVGSINHTYGERSHDRARWPEVWAELRLGKKTGKQFYNSEGKLVRSSASGLGQLTLPNVRIDYPSGVAGIGDPYAEAVGMLRYIKRRYGTPERARALYGTKFKGY